MIKISKIFHVLFGVSNYHLFYYIYIVKSIYIYRGIYSYRYLCI